MDPGYSILPCLLSEYLLSKFPLRSAHSQERLVVILSCDIDEFLNDLLVKSDDIQPLLQKVLLALWMVLPIVFNTEFSRRPGCLGRFADSNSIPWIQTTFRPVLTVAILLKCLLLLVERFFRLCHLSQVDEVLKCGDSMINLHMLSHIPSSCLCIQLSVRATAPRILINFFPSHVRILFCTDKIESIEWQDPHIPHWGLCDPPLSSHGTSLHEVELRQCVFCKEPLLFWFSSRRRNCGLSESENKYCDSLILSPLLQDVPSLFSENCVQGQATLPQDCLWTPSTKKEYLPTDRPNSSCHPSFYFGFRFLRIPAPVSWWLVRHFALILNLKMRLMQPCFQRLSVHLLSAGPVIEL